MWLFPLLALIFLAPVSALAFCTAIPKTTAASVTEAQAEAQEDLHALGEPSGPISCEDEGKVWLCWVEGATCPAPEVVQRRYLVHRHRQLEAPRWSFGSQPLLTVVDHSPRGSLHSPLEPLDPSTGACLREWLEGNRRNGKSAVNGCFT